MNTLETISIKAEVKEIKIFNNQPTTSHPQCTDNISIYFISDKSTIKVDIQAHLQKHPGWGSLKWTKDAQVPAGKQWSQIITTDAQNRPTVGDIAIIVQNKCLEEQCVRDGKCACREWV